MKMFFMVAAVALLPMVGFSQNYEKGMAAAQSGDYATALQEWQPLAEQGHASAQTNLGVMYGNGTGVSQDYAEAVRWYRLAADQGNVTAQTNLGFIYSNGNGVPQDYAEALRWYQMAAEQGNASAQTSLGFMYKYSGGVSQDYVTAHMWLNLASANSNEISGQWRDEIAGTLTAEQIAEAQRRAKVCLQSNYQDCD